MLIRISQVGGELFMLSMSSVAALSVRRSLLAAMATLVSFGFGILAAAPPVAAAEDCRIVIGSCHRVPLSTAEGSGIVDRLAIEAFRRIGHSACVTPLPCERSLLNADQGITDGDILRIPAIVVPLYPNLVAVPEPLYRFTFQGFTTRPELMVHGFDDLGSLRVGFVLGWKVLEEKVRAAEILRARGPEQLFPLLSEGKADLVIYERLTGLASVRNSGIRDVRLLDPPFLVTEQHMVLNRRHADLVEPLAAAIRAMKADGAYVAAFRAAGLEPPP